MAKASKAAKRDTVRREAAKYLGNSAQVDTARDAFRRADDWARSPSGTPYGGVMESVQAAAQTKAKKQT
jgi:hypothetical protein